MSKIRYRVIGSVEDLYLNGFPFDAQASGVAIVITGFDSFMDASNVEEEILEILRRTPMSDNTQVLRDALQRMGTIAGKIAVLARTQPEILGEAVRIMTIASGALLDAAADSAAEPPLRRMVTGTATWHWDEHEWRTMCDMLGCQPLASPPPPIGDRPELATKAMPGKEAVSGRSEKGGWQRIESTTRAVIEAARCIRHWHDTHNGGMIVSGEHVHELWARLQDYDEAVSSGNAGKLEVQAEKESAPTQAGVAEPQGEETKADVLTRNVRAIWDICMDHQEEDEALTRILEICDSIEVRDALTPFPSPKEPSGEPASAPLTDGDRLQWVLDRATRFGDLHRFMTHVLGIPEDALYDNSKPLWTKWREALDAAILAGGRDNGE